MPNSFTAVPNIIPGNLTVQGTISSTGPITDSGNSVMVGSSAAGSARRARLTWDATVGEALSTNLNSDLATRDNTGFPAFALMSDPTGKLLAARLINAGGGVMDMALRLQLFSDYTTHGHTGTVTEDTIYSKLIRGGTIGANGGLLVRVLHKMLAVVTNTVVRVRLGGTQLVSFTFSTASAVGVSEWFIVNQNSQAVQYAVARALQSSAAVVVNDATGAVDTSADQTLTVTAQGGTAGDSLQFATCEVELLNTFGPVT